MDSGATPRRSRRLAGLLPSTYPPSREREIYDLGRLLRTLIHTPWETI